MRKTLINQHKLKRKWGRRIKKTSKFYNSVFSADDCHSQKDFSIKKRLNPHVKREKEFNHFFFIKIFLLLFSLFGMMGMLFYHPFFYLKDIKIIGLQRIKEQEVRESIDFTLDYNKFFILPQKNFFLTNLNEIRDVLTARLPIKSIIVKKTFPQNLEIIIEEKISTVIYDNGNEYSYLDLRGKLVEIVQKVSKYEWIEVIESGTTTDEFGEEIIKEKIIEKIHKPATEDITKELGDFPIVYDKRHKEGNINDQVLDGEAVLGIIKWYDLINKNSDIPLKYFILENDLGDVVIKTYEGWEIRAKLKEGIETQFNELQLVLEEKIKRPNLNYIDLRYNNRVFWQ